jgi:hypothetical protein
LATPKLRRGFIKEAQSYAVELRQEMQILPHAPLCPWALCEHLSVPIIKLSTLPSCDERQLLLKRQKDAHFSAAACFEGTAAFILLNDGGGEAGSNKKRQASDLAHELAHIILGHKPIYPFHDSGLRDFSQQDEVEAETLGPILLVSQQAALSAHSLIESGQQTLTSLSNKWGVTEDVLKWRINKSGAIRRRLIAAQ